MNCPDCGKRMLADMTRKPERGKVTRRRTCRGCGRRFQTLELPAQDLKSVRKDTK